MTIKRFFSIKRGRFSITQIETKPIIQKRFQSDDFSIREFAIMNSIKQKDQLRYKKICSIKYYI